MNIVLLFSVLFYHRATVLKFFDTHPWVNLLDTFVGIEFLMQAYAFQIFKNVI